MFLLGFGVRLKRTKIIADIGLKQCVFSRNPKHFWSETSFLYEKKHESTINGVEKMRWALDAVGKTTRINIQIKKTKNAPILCVFCVFLDGNRLFLRGNSNYLKQLGHSVRVHAHLFTLSVGPADTTVMKWWRFQRPGHRRASRIVWPQRGCLSITGGTSNASTLGQKTQDEIDPKGVALKVAT